MQVKAVLRHPDEAGASFSSGAAQALDRRRTGRRALRLSAAVTSPSIDELPVLVLDISEGGLLLEAERGVLAVDDNLEISLSEQRIVKARVAWQSGRFLGCEFSTSIKPADISAALLKGEPLAAPAELNAQTDRERRSDARGFAPELNFSVALGLALALWAAIGTAAYLLAW